MKPRVCILVKENVNHWAPLYVEAFRDLCDVVTIGPGLDRAMLASHGLGETAAFLEPNDVLTETDDALEALHLLPQGWKPDLVVGLNSGAAPYRNLRRIACPTAYISVDMWHEPEQFTTAVPYDYVFSAQRAFVPYFREAGCRHAEWLPLACAPRRHYPVANEKLLDIVFVGTTHYVVNEQRVARLARLAEHFRVATRNGVSPEQMSHLFALGKLAFNSSVAQDLNMRVFEALGMGLPLLTNRDAEANGLLDLFEDDHHLITYTDENLLERAREYLEDDVRRLRVAQLGRQEVLARHTYQHRVHTLLQTVLCGTPKLETCATLLRASGDAGACVPHGAGRVVDIGRALNCGIESLQRRGVQELLEFDAIGGADMSSPLLADGLKPASVDVLAWRDPLGAFRELLEALQAAHRVLVPGGSLALVLPNASLPATDQLEAAADEARFHVILRDPARDPDTTLILLQKYVRPLREIAREMYRRYPGGQLSR